MTPKVIPARTLRPPRHKCIWSFLQNVKKRRDPDGVGTHRPERANTHTQGKQSSDSTAGDRSHQSSGTVQDGGRGWRKIQQKARTVLHRRSSDKSHHRIGKGVPPDYRHWRNRDTWEMAAIDAKEESLVGALIRVIFIFEHGGLSITKLFG